MCKGFTRITIEFKKLCIIFIVWMWKPPHPHRIVYLDTWSPTVKLFWDTIELLKVKTWLMEVGHEGKAFGGL